MTEMPRIARKEILKPANVPYDEIVAGYDANGEDELIRFLWDVLTNEWCVRYRTMTKRRTNILQFEDHGFEFLFDLTSELQEKNKAGDRVPEDRVVAVFGRSVGGQGKRDASRMRGFLGGPIMRRDGIKSDKGHFIGHSLGGGLDVNLFPQKREVNRGWSKKGKTYRAMERYCADNPGTFCFSCPIYFDDSWTPHTIEYGYLTKDLKLRVEIFDNT